MTRLRDLFDRLLRRGPSPEDQKPPLTPEERDYSETKQDAVDKTLERWDRGDDSDRYRDT